MLVGLTWRPEGGHRGQQQITDAVTVHASATPETQHAHATELSKIPMVTLQMSIHSTVKHKVVSGRVQVGDGKL